MLIAERPVDYILPWDAFLAGEADKQGLPNDGRERWLRALRNHIDTFRRLEWPNLKREIGEKTKWVIPDGMEPHWVASGKAILWQQQKTRLRKLRLLPDGRSEPYIEEEEGEWKPSSQLPCNNAIQIGQWLDLGLRMRPPLEGTATEPLRTMQAIPSTVAVEVPAPASFWCQRHPEKGEVRLVGWKSYVRHCEFYREPLAEAPPLEVMERAGAFKFYCPAHDKGFNYARLAARHVKAELRKPGRAVHPSVEQMEVH